MERGKGTEFGQEGCLRRANEDHAISASDRQVIGGRERELDFRHRDSAVHVLAGDCVYKVESDDPRSAG